MNVLKIVAVLVCVILAVPVYGVSECLEQSHDPTASRTCRNLINSGNISPDIFKRLIQALTGISDLDEALRVADQSLAQFPGNRDLGEIQKQTKSLVEERDSLKSLGSQGIGKSARSSALQTVSKYTCIKSAGQKALDACNEFLSGGGIDQEVTDRREVLVAMLEPDPIPSPEIIEPEPIDKVVVPQPEPQVTPRQPQVSPDQIEKRRLVASIQGELNTLGYNVGRADGIPGPRTARAIDTFYSTTGFSPRHRIGEELLSDLQKAIDLENRANSFLSQSSTELNAGNVESAVELRDRAVQVARWVTVPASLNQELNLARQNRQQAQEIDQLLADAARHFSNSQFDQAISSVDAILSRQPNNSRAMRLKNNVLAEQQRLQDIALAQKQAKQKKELLSSLVAQAESALSKGDLTLAATLASEIKSIDPNSAAEIESNIAKLRDAQNRRLAKLDADKLAQQKREKQIQEVRDYVDQANTAFSNEDYTLAISYLDRADAIDPEIANTASLRQSIEAEKIKQAQSVKTNEQLELLLQKATVLRNAYMERQPERETYYSSLLSTAVKQQSD